jgi:hypothetical protein
MKPNYLIFILALFSCNNSKKRKFDKVKPKMEVTNQDDQIFLGKVGDNFSREIKQKVQAL